MLTQVPDPGGPGAGAVNGGRCAWGGRGGECRPKSQFERGPQSVQSVQGEQALRIGRGMASGGLYRPKGRGFGVARRTGTPAPRHHRHNRHRKRTNKCLHTCQSPAGRGAAGVGGGVAAAPLPTSPDRAGAAVGATSRPGRARRKGSERREAMRGDQRQREGCGYGQGCGYREGSCRLGRRGTPANDGKEREQGGTQSARAETLAQDGTRAASEPRRSIVSVVSCVRACVRACVSE